MFHNTQESQESILADRNKADCEEIMQIITIHDVEIVKEKPVRLGGRGQDGKNKPTHLLATKNSPERNGQH